MYTERKFKRLKLYYLEQMRSTEDFMIHTILKGLKVCQDEGENDDEKRQMRGCSLVHLTKIAT